MNYRISSCVLCGSQEVTGAWDSDRIVVVTCARCRSVVRIEFDPPDAPNLRGRIETLFSPFQDEDFSGEDVH